MAIYKEWRREGVYLWRRRGEETSAVFTAMKMRLANFTLILFILLNVVACINKNDTNGVTYSNKISFQTTEYRDSIFILYTVKEWGKLNWQYFEDYSRMYKITNDNVEYFISRVFYNEDKKKMIGWIGEKVPNAETIVKYSNEAKNNRICPLAGDTVYHLWSVIGLRDSTNQIWKIYPLQQVKLTCFKSKENAINQLEDYFFNKMKEDAENVSKKYLDKNYGGKVRYDLERKTIELGYGDKNSELIDKNYGYNLNDKYFWEKSLLWQKGATIKGFYNFQLFGMDSLKLPAISYPDSILQLYLSKSNP